MKEISMHVGKRIRLYRKMKNMTIEVFAGLINKSKATVSKYENGDIAIDIETLFIIANALDISVNQLIDYDKEAEETETRVDLSGRRHGKTRMYLYFYDGRRSRIVRNVIDIRGTGENGMFSVDLYADVDDYSNCYKCKYLYHGTMRRYDTFTNFQFENQNNKMERVFLYAINSFSPAGRMLGMFSGLSIQPMMPASFKFVLSPDVMEENEELKETLRFSKEDIRTMKKMNMFIINQHL